MNKLSIVALVTATIAAVASTAFSQPLAGTDDLGRILPQNDSVGDLKPDRRIVLFYFLWQGDGTAQNRWDLSDIIARHPEVLEDYDNENWGSPIYYANRSMKGVMYFWGQPIYGYYRGDDYWVHLRSMQLLTDIGVDLLAVDATNRLTYPKQAQALMAAMDAVRAQGKNPPKIVFYTNTRSGETMQEVYDNFYKPDAPYRHPECWFYLKEKPLIIGISNEAVGKVYQPLFTFRESQWPNEAQKINGWPWIDFNRPQKVHFNDRGEKEIINVSVCQHPNVTAGMGGSAFYGNKDNWGRSYRNGSHGHPEVDLPFGYNFQEQWDYALQQDTPFIFVTGWNEWVAGKWPSRDGNPEHSWFCDQASAEYSRDVEPTVTANLKDNYYLQMAANIRRYKGIDASPVHHSVKPLVHLNDWEQVSQAFFDYTGDIQPRNHPGAQSLPETVYTNYTGRNDFHVLKTAHTPNQLYFYAETQDKISPASGRNWMRLYIDVDRSFRTGWKGYDFRIDGGRVLMHYTGNSWMNAAEIKHEVEGKRLMLTVPRKLVGMTEPLNFEFKWSDNMQNDDDPMDWYVNGDVAPGGRFNYMYRSED